jgi:uncharacterized membrane protein
LRIRWYIYLGNALIPLNLLTWVLILIIIFFPSNVLRIILGIPLLLFFPGYTLMAAIFTKKEEISGTARVALSFGLSIALVPLTGLILNYTPWGIRLEPILYSLALFIFIVSIIAWLRSRRLTRRERFGIELYLRLVSWAEALRLLGRGEGFWDKVLAITLLVAILGALGTLGYIIATPKTGETFTEFYILGPEGKAADYPAELKVGEEGRVIVGIINHEGKEVSYRVEVAIGDKKTTEVGPVTLADEQKWEGEVDFMPEVVGQNQKVEFLLYKDGEVEPYLEPLQLWVDVTE